MCLKFVRIESRTTHEILNVWLSCRPRGDRLRLDALIPVESRTNSTLDLEAVRQIGTQRALLGMGAHLCEVDVMT